MDYSSSQTFKTSLIRYSILGQIVRLLWIFIGHHNILIVLTTCIALYAELSHFSCQNSETANIFESITENVSVFHVISFHYVVDHGSPLFLFFNVWKFPWHPSKYSEVNSCRLLHGLNADSSFTSTGCGSVNFAI